MNIKTEYWPKPIPVRLFDWEAWNDDLNEDSPIGYGETKEDAISDLKGHISNNKTGFDELGEMSDAALKLLAR